MSDLFGTLPEEGPATDRLFLAVFPDEATSRRMEALAHEIRARHGLTGRPQAWDRLHITLHHLGDFRAIPQAVVDAASRAVSSLVATPAFDVRLDRAISFRGGEHKPLVLVGQGEGTAPIEAFQRKLQSALVRYGIKPDPRFKPHVTLLRDSKTIAEEPVPPFQWTVGEVVLVHSLLGRTRHVPLARWSLGVAIGPPEATAPEAFTDTDRHWMRRALALAEQAGGELDEVPVGAVVVGPDGALLAEASNLTGDRHDPGAHAEMLAIAAAGRTLGSKRLAGCTLYVSLEPCPMCAAALVHARVATLVFAAVSPKTGAAGSMFGVVGDYGGAGDATMPDVSDDHRQNHRVVVKGGLMAEEASRLLSDWFRRKREAAR